MNTYSFQRVKSTHETDVFPRCNYGVFWEEVFCSDDGFANVPFDSLSHFDACFIVTSRQVTLKSTIELNY